MRCIGIIGAMEVEVEKLKARMENVEITRKLHGILCRNS